MTRNARSGCGTLLQLALAALISLSAPETGNAASQQSDPNGQWKALTPAFPSGRRWMGYTYDSLRRRLVVFGGNPNFLNDVWAFDLSSYSWSQIVAAGTPPPQCYGASMILDAARDRLVIFGGYTGATYTNAVYILTLSGVPTWTRLFPTGTAPPGRNYHVAAYDGGNDRMIVFGGLSGNTLLGDTWALTFGGTPAWTQLAPAGPLPQPRDMAGVTVDPVGKRMFVFGGWNSGYRSDTWTFSFSGAPAWTQIATFGTLPARRECAVAWDAPNSRLVAFGGNNGAPLPDVWALNLSGIPSWQQLTPPAGAEARYGNAAIYDPAARQFVVFGGTQPLGNTNDAWGLSMEGTPGWKLLSRPKLPVRNYATAYDPVAHQMLLFGGEQKNLAGQVALTGDLYALPLTGLPLPWTLVTPAGTRPTPRSVASAIWDPVRDRMLLFGGYDGTYLNELWEYRPRPAPTWTLLETSGTPPAGRFACGTVYDAENDRLVVFGGYYSSPDALPTNLNDTWALRFSGTNAMKWRRLITGGIPPSPRWGFVMVSDPKRQRAIVMGGAQSSSQPFSDSYTLDLTSDQGLWAPLSTVGATPPRLVRHTAIVEPDGDRMVTFGGWIGSDAIHDVYALSFADPPAWSVLAPAGLPPRSRDAMLAVYDPVHRGLVVACGERLNTMYDDTWELTWNEDVTGVGEGGPATPGLALAGAQPNPSTGGALRVAFSLERRGPARLDLIDVAGRRVASRDLSALDAGRHVISVAGEGQLAPGLYLVKLTAGGRSLTAKAFVVR
jgi:hypothetical protein